MSTLQQEINDVYSNWRTAVIENDVEFLKNLYCDDFALYNSSCGIFKNKSEELARLHFNDLKYLSWKDQNVLIESAGEEVIFKCQQKLNLTVFDLPIAIDREIVLTFVKVRSEWYIRNIKENEV